jgi:hypothetical protein
LIIEVFLYTGFEMSAKLFRTIKSIECLWYSKTKLPSFCKDGLLDLLEREGRALLDLVEVEECKIQVFASFLVVAARE